MITGIPVGDKGNGQKKISIDNDPVNDKTGKNIFPKTSNDIEIAV